MTEKVNRDLWSAFAELVRGAFTGKDDSGQILPMLVTMPLEADWFDDDTRAGALTAEAGPPHPADRPLAEIAADVDAVAREAAGGGDGDPTSLSALQGPLRDAIPIPDPDDMSALISGPTDPGTALEAAKTDEDGVPVDRGDPAYSADAKTKPRVALTRAQQNFLNLVAFLPAQYNMLWAPGAVRVADAYKSLLLQIRVAKDDMTPEAAERIDKANQALASATNGYSDLQLDAAGRYQEYATKMRAAGMKPDPPQQFLDDNGYTDKLAAALTKRNSDNAAFRQVVQDVGLREDLIDAVAAVNSRLPQLFVRSEVKESPQKWPTYTQTTSSSSKHSKSVSTQWGGKVSGMYDFISLGAKASGSSEHTTVDTSEIEMEISFRSQQVTIIPGVAEGKNWNNLAVLGYVGHLLENEKNSWAKTSVFDAENGSREPYGSNGFLPFWPTGVLLAYQPTIKLSMSKTSYDKTGTSWKAGVDIGVGPFKFSPSASHSNVEVSETGDTTTVTLTDTSTTPKVLGFLMQVMPPGGQE